MSWAWWYMSIIPPIQEQIEKIMVQGQHRLKVRETLS
jgi:hypothetical protein